MSDSDTNDQPTVTVTTYANDVGGHSPTMSITNGHAAVGSCPWTMEHGGGSGHTTATAGDLVGSGSSFPAAIVGDSAPTSKSSSLRLAPAPAAGTTRWLAVIGPWLR